MWQPLGQVELWRGSEGFVECRPRDAPTNADLPGRRIGSLAIAAGGIEVDLLDLEPSLVCTASLACRGNVHILRPVVFYGHSAAESSIAMKDSQLCSGSARA